MPPESVLRTVCKLVQYYGEYMMIAGVHDAMFKDVSDCFEVVSNNVLYRFGYDAHVKAADDFIKIQKRGAQHTPNQTPQKGGPRKKHREAETLLEPKMSSTTSKHVQKLPF